MLILAVVFVVLAALIHGYIFVLESLRWRQPATRQIFGTTEESAEITAPLAYNQGFYNLFLGIGALIGAGLLVAGRDNGGLALAMFSCGCMLAAALVLITSDKTLARAAVVQGTVPLIALIDLVVWCVTS